MNSEEARMSLNRAADKCAAITQSINKLKKEICESAKANQQWLQKSLAKIAKDAKRKAKRAYQQFGECELKSVELRKKICDLVVTLRNAESHANEFKEVADSLIKATADHDDIAVVHAKKRLILLNAIADADEKNKGNAGNTKYSSKEDGPIIAKGEVEIELPERKSDNESLDTNAPPHMILPACPGNHKLTYSCGDETGDAYFQCDVCMFGGLDRSNGYLFCKKCEWHCCKECMQ
ncbi:MAG: hypothetical protein P4L69_21910 [Desulfosporosinus sp.]|nr:hypothetical protein [Desulfosporosinus sp.]